MYLTFSAWRALTRISPPRKSTVDEGEAALLAAVAALAISPGTVVTDVGAGTGVFTELFSQKVGAGGTVIAQDISPDFIRGIMERARQSGLDNVQTLLGTDKDARLPHGGVDLIFTSDTYHHFEYPQAMLSSLRAALRPAGRLIVIDYEKLPGRSSPWILSHVRANRETVIAEVEAAGFRLLKVHHFLRENYFLEFGRR